MTNVSKRGTPILPAAHAGLPFAAILSCVNLCYSLSVISFTTGSDGVTFTCNTGLMKIQICQADIARVVYASTAAFPQKTSLCVNKTWPTPVFSVSDIGDTIALQTGRIKVKVSRSTAAITFTDLAGNVVLSENDKSMTPATVEGVATYTGTTKFNSPSGEGLFGLGQHMINGTTGRATIVNYKGRNEIIEQVYEGGRDHFSASIPLLVSTRGYGLFWDNYSKSFFYGGEANNTQYRYTSECGSMIDYYFFYGPGLDTVISLFRTATGKAPVLPKWSYGLIQSRERYSSQSEILAVKDGYRNNKIPVDCIVQDWFWWDPNPWGSHIFNSTRWPNPKSMVDQLHAANIHAMISIWPVFAAGSANYNELNAIGGLWTSSGSTRNIDVYNPQARSIYWKQLCNQRMLADGWDSWWCDATEPEQWTLNLHSITTAMGKGAFYYNTYSHMLMLEGYTGWRRDIPGKRVSILSRSAFAGQQRTGAVTWNNDIMSSFPTLANSLPAGLNFQLSGNPNWCTDIGGFDGYFDWGTPGKRDLFTRWFQYGAFCSIFRIHGGGSRELYCSAWDNTTKANLLKIDHLRYRLLPYIYSLAWKTANNDYTMQRHLVMDFRNDANVYNIGNQFMFGPAFLVSPITDSIATSRSAYLPAGTWYDFWTGTTQTGGKTMTATALLDKIPLHVRAGSIIPMGPIIQYATERSDSIEVRVYGGANGSFTLYEDEGDNYNYESGHYATIPMTYDNSSGKVTIGARTGTFVGMQANKVFSIVFVRAGHGVDVGKTSDPDCIFTYNGTSVTACPATGALTVKPLMPHPKPIILTAMQGTAINIPAGFSGLTKHIAIYSLSGRLLKTAVIRKNVIDVRKDFSLFQGACIVNIKVANTNGK